jgi:hypothetical protein
MKMSKTAVMRRLTRIHKKAGIFPKDLRRLSSQFQTTSAGEIAKSKDSETEPREDEEE